MKKKIMVLCVLILLILGIIYYRRPVTIEEIYPKIDLSECTRIKGSIHEDIMESWAFSLNPKDEQFEDMIDLLRLGSFRSGIRNIIPFGTGLGAHTGLGVCWDIYVFFDDVQAKDGNQEYDADLWIENWFGDIRFNYTSTLTNKRQIWECKASEQWLQEVLSLARNCPPKKTIDSSHTADLNTQKNAQEALKRFVANDTKGLYDIIYGPERNQSQAFSQDKETVYKALEEYLNANDIIIYNYDSNEESEGPAVSRDVSMQKVIIAHDINNDLWIVTGGGYWRTDLYKDDTGSLPLLKDRHAVGGVDVVGVVLSNTNGKIPACISSSGYVNDGNGHCLTLNNPCNSNSKDGVLFEFQDEFYKSEGFLETSYMGYGFASQGVYNADFAEYHGFARSYYLHTGNDCHITSRTISENGIVASWDPFSSGWEAYSNGSLEF